MEDILASIKRIIAEDSGGPVAPRPRRPAPARAPLDEPEPAAEADGEPVLELTDAVAPPAEEAEPPRPVAFRDVIAGIVRTDPPAAAEPQPEPAPGPAAVEASAPAAAEAPKPVAAEASPVAQAPAERRRGDGAEGAPSTPILSDTAAQASRHALAALSALMVKPAPEHDGTLEGLVREMLRPMLKDWLDARLPEIVEAMVAREIERIVGRSL